MTRSRVHRAGGDGQLPPPGRAFSVLGLASRVPPTPGSGSEDLGPGLTPWQEVLFGVPGTRLCKAAPGRGRESAPGSQKAGLEPAVEGTGRNILAVSPARGKEGSSPARLAEDGGMGRGLEDELGP